MSPTSQILQHLAARLSSLGASGEMIEAATILVGDELSEAVNAQVRESYRTDPDDELPQRPRGCTELEAALRWCPFSREVVTINNKSAGIGNRYLDPDGSDYANPAGSRCIGGHCLAWRWDDPLRGHCGLAGSIKFQPLGEPREFATRTPLPRPTLSDSRDLFEEDDR